MRIDQFMPDQAILEELGARLARVRKAQGHSQEALAKEAGLGVATLRRIEDGRDGQLGSWLKLLKALQMASSIENLLPESLRSPREEAMQTTSRRRRKPKGPDFTWGDEPK